MSILRGRHGSVLARSSITIAARSVRDHVAKLLRSLELAAANVDRVARGVVDPRHRPDVRRAVRADRRDPSELPPAGQVPTRMIDRSSFARRGTIPDTCGMRPT
jgi:hypothetical protein